MPFLRLRELFGSNTPPDLHQKVVIVSAGETKVGLVIDQIIGSHQTVIKSLSKLHADVGAFSGATILGDGTTALILDIAHVIELGQAQIAHPLVVGALQPVEEPRQLRQALRPGHHKVDQLIVLGQHNLLAAANSSLRFFA